MAAEDYEFMPWECLLDNLCDSMAEDVSKSMRIVMLGGDDDEVAKARAELRRLITSPLIGWHYDRLERMGWTPADDNPEVP